MKVDAFGQALVVGGLYTVLQRNGGLNITIVGRLISENTSTVNLEPVQHIHFLSGERITLREDLYSRGEFTAFPFQLVPESFNT